MRFSKQISNANISAPRRDNPSKILLKGRPVSALKMTSKLVPPGESRQPHARRIGTSTLICSFIIRVFIRSQKTDWIFGRDILHLSMLIKTAILPSLTDIICNFD